MASVVLDNSQFPVLGSEGIVTDALKVGGGGISASGTISFNNGLNVNGVLKVTQPDGAGLGVLNLTDGNTGAAENALQVYLNAPSTTLTFVDSGGSQSITYEGGATNGFNFTAPILGRPNPADPNVLGSFTVRCPDALAVPLFNFTDGNAGAAENGLQLNVVGPSTNLTWVDSGVIGTISFEGSGTQPLFIPTQPISHPAVQSKVATGIASGVPIGGLLGVTASSVVMVTMVANSVAVVPFSLVTGVDSVTPTFAGGGTADFNVFVAKY